MADANDYFTMEHILAESTINELSAFSLRMLKLSGSTSVRKGLKFVAT